MDRYHRCTIASALRNFAPQFEDLTLRQCLVATEVLERLFQYAYSAKSRGDVAIIEEARSILRQYFAAYADK